MHSINLQLIFIPVAQHLLLAPMVCARHEFRHWGCNSNTDIQSCPWRASFLAREDTKYTKQINFLVVLNESNRRQCSSRAYGEVRAGEVIVGASAQKRWLKMPKWMRMLKMKERAQWHNLEEGCAEVMWEEKGSRWRGGRSSREQHD